MKYTFIQQHYSNYVTKSVYTLSSGWQPRWFVLDGGTLSYYDSQEDAWKGCKGSIKISVCEIQGLYCSLNPVFSVKLCELILPFGHSSEYLLFVC